MDVLFLVGAAVIGATVQFWRAVAIAGSQLVVGIVAVLNLALGLGIPPLALLAVYVICIGLGFATYLQGLKLAKDHPRRETCELLGASSVFGMLGVVAANLAAIAMR
jgi:hypothetical protein